MRRRPKHRFHSSEMFLSPNYQRDVLPQRTALGSFVLGDVQLVGEDDEREPRFQFRRQQLQRRRRETRPRLRSPLLRRPSRPAPRG